MIFDFLKKQNIPDKILSKKYMKDFFDKRLSEIDGEAKKINKIEIYPAKKHIEKKLFHLVVFYKLFIEKKNGDKKQQMLVYIGHSDNLRKKAYSVLKLAGEKIQNEEYGVPTLLWYIDNLEGFFYYNVHGSNILNKVKNDIDVGYFIKLTARFFAEFHQIESNTKLGLKKFEFDLKYLDPSGLIEKNKNNKYLQDILSFYKKIKEEKNNFELRLSHGDLHLENIIANIDHNWIRVIDFSEACLAPIEYDLGSFVQQLRFMTKRKLDKQKLDRLEKLFLDEYFETSNIKRTKEVEQKINLFKAWTALKSAVSYLYFGDKYLDKIEYLLGEVKYYLAEYDK